MIEIAVVSGKGGTGKTSVLAGFAALADKPVLADCDVDASDLHLVLDPTVRKRTDFYSGHLAVVNEARCSGCGSCSMLCRFDAIAVRERGGRIKAFVDPVSCEGCGVCVRFCPRGAVSFPERLCGVAMESDTRFGPMAHAELGVAGENSGLLVSHVREAARALATTAGRGLILIDGPPGIGCAAIAAIAGCSAVVAVTEPTPSGAHDLKRLMALAKHFRIPVLVCVNRWDISPRMTETIEAESLAAGAMLAGRIRHDRMVTEAQMRGRSVVETDAPAAEDIRTLWQTVRTKLYKENSA